MDYVIYLQTAIMITILLFYFRDRRVLASYRARVYKLTKKNSNEKKPGNIFNRRKNFRVPIRVEDCTLKFLQFDDENLNKLKGRELITEIENISAQGLKVIAELNLPIKQKVIINIRFNLDNEEYSFKGEIVRKEVHLKEKHVAYGIRFIEVEEEEERSLVRYLNKILTERRQKIS